MLGTLLLAMAITSTDQTVQVSKGTKLDVNNFAGDVIVKVWDRTRCASRSPTPIARASTSSRASRS